MENNKRCEKGFDDPVRQVIKREVIHFTEDPTIQHFAEVKVSKNDNVYGITWANLVKEYLKTAYSGESMQAEIVESGVTYKVLRKENVTAFYDADGNTLFDVENKRLAKEYGWVMDELMDQEGKVELSEPVTSMGKAIADIERQALDNALSKEGGEVTEKEQDEIAGESVGTARESERADVIPMGTASTVDIVTGNVLPPTAEESARAEEKMKTVPKNPEEIKSSAKSKLEDELKKAKDKAFADPVIKHLLKRCEDDLGLCEDICQPHKMWDKCLDYVYSQARKQATGSRCAVRDDVVYEWAEDYYHKNDKAEEIAKAEKAKREAEKKKKSVIANKGKAKPETSKSGNKTEIKTPKKTEAKKKEEDQIKPKKKAKEMDGQLDFFSMMGL